MKLVIVESPTKAKTISKFLGKEYEVESSYGHVRDLPKSKLGVDVEKNFEPQYIIPTKARKNLTSLKKAAAKSDGIILATDEDREGEAIAWHLLHALGLDSNKKIERIVFHEITKGAIQESLKNSREINLSLVNAQQGRRVLDRLVGYKLSPFLWKKVAKGLSAGRVQSVAVRLVVEREEEIRNFKPQEYWTIDAEIETESGEKFKTSLVKISGNPLQKFDINNEPQANEIVNDLKGAEIKSVEIKKKETKKNPLPPFTTSTLQQTASSRLGYSSKKTMYLAQQLYEKGLITYMRTDSLSLSRESLDNAKAWLQKSFGDKYSGSSPRIFKAKSRLAQEAHEAIRPTDVSKTPEDLKTKEGAEKKLYNLIWSRFVGSQMPEALFDATTIELEVKGKNSEYTLRANGNIMKFDGFLRVWSQKLSENQLPEVKEDEKLKILSALNEQHFTEPPPRYSEATLIKALEENGIGRPSTYAPTISTIQDRNYVNKENKRLHPTEIGELVNKVLIEHFPKIVDVDFTASMEESLDLVAEGKEEWQKSIKEFYEPFAKILEEKYESVKKAVEDEKTDEVCEKCEKPMIIKFGRFGKFLACSGFPDCKNTKNLAGNSNKPATTGIKCDKCNDGELIMRKVSKGRARGKVFWGCNKYPDCDNATWDNPLKKDEGGENPKEDQKEEGKDEDVSSKL